MRDRETGVLPTLLVIAGCWFFVALLSACGYPRPVPVPEAAPTHTRVQKIEGTQCVATLPLVIRSNAGARALSNALQAGRAWSDAAGMPLVRAALDGDHANVTINVEPCPDDYLGESGCTRIAQTKQRCDGAVYQQTIQIFETGDDAYEFYTLMHEIGHALEAEDHEHGLDEFGHSPDESSIVYKYLAAAPGSKLPAQWVRPNDIAALRRNWGLQ